MLRCRTGPLQISLVKTLVAHARISRVELRNVVKDVRCCFEAPFVSEALCKFHEYSPVFPCLARCFHRFAEKLYRAGRIGACAGFFGPAGCRENYIRLLSGLRKEYILYYEEIQLVKGVRDVVRVRVSYHWVFTHDV